MGDIYAVTIHQAFFQSCKSGQLRIAQWLFSLTTIPLNDNEYVLRETCLQGHFPVVSWLCSLGVTFRLPDDILAAVQKACSIGHIEMLKWLYSLTTIPDIHSQAVRRISMGGHLDILFWLRTLPGFDIEFDKDLAFRLACSSGKSKLAQLLLSFGSIDIHGKNDYAFKYACIYGHLNIAKWLYSLGNVTIPLTERSFVLGVRSHQVILDWLNSLPGVII
jgi:hypothetical protein